LEAYLGRPERWLRDWRIAINVSKSTAVLLVKTARRIQKSRASQILGEPIKWVETARYLGVTVDTQLTWSAQVNQVGKKVAKIFGVLDLLVSKRSGLSFRNGVLLYKHLRSASLSHVGKLQALQSKCLLIATNAP
jgi:hypothetical protein